MKAYTKYVAACMAACVLLSGCSAQSEAEQGSTNNSEPQISSEGIRTVTTITEVFGDGQKPSAAALEYPGEIDSASLSIDDFQAEGRTITAVYTNDEAGLTDYDVPGNYVILRFAYENTSGSASMGGGAPSRNGGMDGKEEFSRDAGAEKGGMDRNGGMELEVGMKPDGAEVDGGKLGRGDMAAAGGQNGRGEEASAANSPVVSVAQVGEVTGADGTIYPAGQAPVESSGQIDWVVQDFQLLEYTDPETGCTIPYSLYLPEDYDESKEYPLLFFVADASANGDDLTRNLTQGNGATVWATPEEQAKHECIVLSPQYTNTLISSLGALVTDDNVWTDGLTLVSNLLHDVIEEYSVDESRIYGTGQSQGCMTNIALSDKYPDLFAAQLLVAGQWNVEEMSAMKDKNLWIVVCEGDSKAYPGMNAATENWESLGSPVARSEMWDSTSTPEQFDELVARTEAQGCKINYTVLEGGSHTYTWSVAYNVEGIRDWLFAQTKE